MAVRTKQVIRQAFIELLNERPLDKISVKDIAERSTVNRNTFYYYYADIYALVEEIFQTETQLFMEKLRSYASWEEAFREATAFVSENKRAVHHLFNSGNRNILEHYYHKAAADTKKGGPTPAGGRSSLCFTVRLRERAGRIWRRSAQTRCGRRAYRCAPREAFRAD